MSRTCARGAIRKANQARAAEPRKSKANWTSTAARRTGQTDHAGIGLARERDDERASDRVPRARDDYERPFGVLLPLHIRGQVPEQKGDRHAERHHRGREQEEHRNEDELRRDRRADADLELHLRRHRIRGDEEDEKADGRVPVSGERKLKDGAGGEERQGADARDAGVAALERRTGAGSALLDQGVAVLIRLGDGRGRRQPDGLSAHLVLPSGDAAPASRSRAPSAA